MPVRLRSLMPSSPADLLKGAWGEWATLILICGMCISICYAAMPKNLTEGRKGKAVAIFSGLAMGIGLYMATDVYGFRLESFGFLAIALFTIVMAMTAYGLIKMQLDKDTAAAVTYCIVFLSFYMTTPSLFDAFAATLPILNGILFLAFFYLLGKGVFKLATSGKSRADDPAAAQEHQFQEAKEWVESPKGLPRENRRVTKLPDMKLKTLKEIDDSLKRIIAYLENLNGWIEPDQAKATVKSLGKILATKPSMLKRYQEHAKAKLQALASDQEAQAQFQQHAAKVNETIQDFYARIEAGVNMLSNNNIRQGTPELIKGYQTLQGMTEMIRALKLGKKEDLKEKT